MKQSLSLKLGQSLAMTPALQQAIRMLQLSSLELQAEVTEMLDQNFMLETVENSEDRAGSDGEVLLNPSERGPDAEQPATAEAPELDAPASTADDWSMEDSGWRDSSGDTERYEYQQANLHEAGDLREHLAWQANLCTLEGVARELLAHLIDAINDDGYLDDWDGIAQRLAGDDETRAEALHEALAMLQSLDPTGVGARDVPECLLLQLRHPEHEVDDDVLDTARRIVRDHLDLLARHDHDRLARAVGCDTDTVNAAIQCIRGLSPHPGRAFQGAPPDYVVPDVLVAKRNGIWQVHLNPEAVPRVRINRQYAALVRRAERSDEQQTLRRHLQEAKQLVSALRARHDTLLRVAHCIVEQQAAFMEHGVEHMRPLVLREIAERLGIHESTVSRATANKYMLTPLGVFELKYFFSSSIRTTKGGSASATAIQAKLKRLIQAEPTGKPLSDARLSELLRDEGMEVARRTVAKYREGMGIPPAHERRRMA
ncbi:RNA polymerase factor sigma-54 [Algiphilus sp.]|uniref:RNA polymerase factor sigma-54 n=1 Tax=Algiphilus sp. TaxID=1872431 RepID=UPI0025BBF067|nr:RNA polymerase factor sigma-54 [Algiphilus sp.]MCK5769411.1 RNA polymerase factor sigma-54 [Algiphilus sp.]